MKMSLQLPFIRSDTECMACGATSGLTPLEDTGLDKVQWKWLCGGRIPQGSVCIPCTEQARRSFQLRAAMTESCKEPVPMSQKIRQLRSQLRQLTKKVDVFIVIGPTGENYEYSSDDIVMVDRAALGQETPPRPVPLQCSVCPRSNFISESELHEHIDEHPAYSSHSCWSCGEQYSSREFLSKHLCQQEEPSRMQQTLCPACGYDATSRVALTEHCKLKHGRNTAPPIVCPICLAMVPNSAGLSAHLVRHKRGSMPQMVCGHNGCVMRFSTRTNLLQHVRTSHTD